MKKFISLLLVLTLMFSLVACGGSDKATDDAAVEPSAGSEPESESSAESKEADSTAASGEKVKVGFVVKSLADQFWVLVKAGAENTAAELGNVELTFIAPNAESDVQAQVDMIQNLVGQGIDVLCVAPSSPDAVLPVLQQAHDAGIKILAVDTDTTFPEKLSFIGTGNEAAGKLGGDYVVEKLGKDKKAIVLRGRLGDPTHDQREAGWVAGLEAGGYEILEVQAADSEAEKAMNITQNLLTKYDQIDVIVTTADSMAQGAQRAVEATGMDVQVMGFDGTVPVVEMTVEGKFMGTVAQDPYNMGVVGIKEAVKVAQGETIEDRIDTGAVVVGQENAEDFLAQLKERLGE